MKLSRRHLLALPVVSAATAALASCSSTNDSTAGSTSTGASGSGWSFTDALGNTTTLEATPTRIAGYSDAVGSLWNYGITPVAVFGGFAAPSEDPQLAGKDFSGVAQVGSVYGEVDLEALAAAAPDLIVAAAFATARGVAPAKDTVLYGFNDATQQKQVAAIAPLVATVMDGTADDVCAEVAKLARAIGGDDVEATVAQAEKDFATASDRLKAAAVSGVSVAYIAGYPGEGLYVVRPPDDPTTAYFAKLGVTMPDPGGDDFYWYESSWENAIDLAVDVLLYNPLSMDLNDAKAQPTFAALAAVTAGQVFEFRPPEVDHVALTTALNQVAGWLESSRKLV